MSFKGKRLIQCRSFEVTSNYYEVVWVPTTDFIACGHVLFFIGLRHGFNYFHVPGINGDIDGVMGLFDEPYFFQAWEFENYIKLNKKNPDRIVRRRYYINAGEKKLISRKLSQTMERKWIYMLVANNCQSFIEEVVRGVENRMQDDTPFDCPGIDYNIMDFKRNVARSAWYKFINYILSKDG